MTESGDTGTDPSETASRSRPFRMNDAVPCDCACCRGQPHYFQETHVAGLLHCTTCGELKAYGR